MCNFNKDKKEDIYNSSIRSEKHQGSIDGSGNGEGVCLLKGSTLGLDVDSKEGMRSSRDASRMSCSKDW